MGRVYAVRPENAGERALRNVRVFVKDIGNEWTEFRWVTRVAFDCNADEGPAGVTFLPENSDRRPRSAGSVALCAAKATIYVTAKLEPIIGCPVPKAEEPVSATEATPTSLRVSKFKVGDVVVCTIRNAEGEYCVEEVVHEANPGPAYWLTPLKPQRVFLAERYLALAAPTPSSQMQPEPKFKIGDRVYRTTSQHSEPGCIRSMFLADDGSPRYVFQYDQPKGNLFITNESQLSLERKSLPGHNS